MTLWRREPIANSQILGGNLAFEGGEEVVPSHQIESLLDVKLEENGRGLGLVKSTRIVPHVYEVVMDAPSFDECTLGARDEAIHEMCQTSCHQFHNNLSHGMDEANRTIIGDGLGPLFLREQNNICGVEPMKVLGMEV